MRDVYRERGSGGGRGRDEDKTPWSCMWRGNRARAYTCYKQCQEPRQVRSRGRGLGLDECRRACGGGRRMEEREGGWERKGAEAGEGEEGGGTGGGRERRRGRWGERESEKQRHTYQQRENTEARHVTRRHQDDTQDDTRHDSRAWEHRHKTTDTRQSTTHALKARGLLHLSHKHTGAHNKWRKVGRHDK